MKRINVKEVYPETHLSIVENLLKGVIGLIGQCNSDTVFIPIATLKYLIKIDEEMTRNISREVS